MDWFRWHHGSVTDPKFQLVAKRAKASVAEVVAVWAYVLETASQSPKRGHVGGLDAEAIDLALGMDDGTTEAILAVLHDRGMLSEGRVASWDKRQPKREDETANDRKRRQREREHELALAAVSPGVTEVVSRNVTQSHVESRSVTLEEKREEEKEQEQELTPPTPRKRGEGVGSHRKLKAVPAQDRFAEFWQAYPRKVAKPAAEKAWRRVAGEADAILAGLRRSIGCEQWAKGGGQFIPHPATWLNGRRWEDSIDAGTASASGYFKSADDEAAFDRQMREIMAVAL